MNLYEKINNKVDVYTLIPIEDRIKEYKKAQLEKEDIDSLFYYMETDSYTIINRFYREDNLDIRFLEHDELEHDDDEWYSKIKNRPTNAYQRLLLDNYINGIYTNILPIQTFIPDGGVDCRLNAYLCTEFYKKVKNGQSIIYTLDNILKLSKNLCNLQLLLNGNVSQINCFSFYGIEKIGDELLGLFKVIKEDYSIDSEELLKIAKSDLISESPDRIELDINTKSKLLRRIKELS